MDHAKRKLVRLIVETDEIDVGMPLERLKEYLSSIGIDPDKLEAAGVERVLVKSIHPNMEVKTCTKDSPFTERPEDTNFRWMHPDAEEVAEDYGPEGGVADGDFVKYKCPNCGHTWWEELPN